MKMKCTYIYRNGAKFLCSFVYICLLALPSYAAHGRQAKEGFAGSSSEAYFKALASVSGLDVTPVKGFLDENLFSMLMLCDRSTEHVGSAGQPNASYGFGIGAIWSSADHHCSVLYCDVIPEERDWTKDCYLRDIIMKPLSVNVSCGQNGETKVNSADYILSTGVLGKSKGLQQDSVCVFRLPHPACMRIALDDVIRLADTQFPHDHCLGLYVSNRSGLLMRVVILFDDKGFKHKDKYIDKLLASIRLEE